MFKNMKIAINEQQPLDEVVRELKRIGFYVGFIDDLKPTGATHYFPLWDCETGDFDPTFYKKTKRYMCIWKGDKWIIIKAKFFVAILNMKKI